MSIIKKLDDISGTDSRSKSLTEAINKVEEAMNKLKGSKKTTKSETKKDKEEVIEEA